MPESTAIFVHSESEANSIKNKFVNPAFLYFTAGKCQPKRYNIINAFSVSGLIIPSAAYFIFHGSSSNLEMAYLFGVLSPNVIVLVYLIVRLYGTALVIAPHRIIEMRKSGTIDILSVTLLSNVELYSGLFESFRHKNIITICNASSFNPRRSPH